MGTIQIIEKGTDRTGQEPADKAPLASEGTAHSDNKDTSPEKTYTQKELDTLIQMAQTKAGRDLAAGNKERDSLKAKLAENETSLADKQAELEDVQAQVDDLAAGSPELEELLKDKKKLKADMKKLTEDRAKLDAEKTEYAETLKFVQTEKRAIDIGDVLIGFKVPEDRWDSMYELADRFGASTKEDFEALAKTIGGIEPEKKAEGKDKTVHVDSGRGSGSSPKSFTRQQIAEMPLAEYSKNRLDIEKAQREGRIK